MPDTPDALLAQARAAFTTHFGGEPTVAGLAPGRVELLGNHTDYNGGLVMAAAIDRYTVVAGRSAPGRSAHIESVIFDQSDRFSLDEIERTEDGAWTRYVRGVCWALSEQAAPLASGFEASIVGDVPLGAGLSSSASLQASVARFLIELGIVAGFSSDGLGADDRHDSLRMHLAHVLRRSENEFVGVGSGLLDQFASLFGRANHALFLDCETLFYERVSMGTPTPAIIVCDSKTSRRLADGMYDTRRAETERVTAFFRDRFHHQGSSRLSSLTLEQLATHWDELDPVGRKRARHVLNENVRVRKGVDALKSGDIVGFGRLMSESHVSSRDDFDNSSPALDALIETAESAPGFLGGKLSGAGWAGCTVNLVAMERAFEFADAVKAAYCRATGTVPDVHICQAADGASSLGFDTEKTAK